MFALASKASTTMLSSSQSLAPMLSSRCTRRTIRQQSLTLVTNTQYQDASEMSQIDQPLIGNLMENRRVRRRANAPRMEALVQEPNWEGLDSQLRRKEKLASMHEEVSARICTPCLCYRLNLLSCVNIVSLCECACGSVKALSLPSCTCRL
jgi:hypothetical protein